MTSSGAHTGLEMIKNALFKYLEHFPWLLEVDLT